MTWTPPAAPPDVLTWGPVRLDRWRRDDLEDAYTAVDSSREHLARFMPWSRGYERTSAAAYLEQAAQDWDDRTAFNYRISAPDLRPDRALGSASLMARRGPQVLEIGYWVRADAVGRGLARRAAAALTDAGFALADDVEIWICHEPENTASAAIPARLGFTRQAEPVPAPPDFTTGADVCWTLSKDAWVPVRG
jgi:RimJ/RimL family protein N-acetyltransferase